MLRLIALASLEYAQALAMRQMLGELKGFNQGLDVARRIFGPWDVRDPIEDMKPSHAGVVAFRSVFDC